LAKIKNTQGSVAQRRRRSESDPHQDDTRRPSTVFVARGSSVPSSCALGRETRYSLLARACTRDSTTYYVYSYTIRDTRDTGARQ